METLFTLKEILGWNAGILVALMLAGWTAIAGFYRREVRRAQQAEKDLSRKLENQEADLDNCKNQLAQVKDRATAYHQSLETERSMRQSQDQEFQKEKARLQQECQDRLTEVREQLGTIITAKDEQMNAARRIDQGGAYNTRVWHWEGLFQIVFTSFVPFPVEIETKIVFPNQVRAPVKRPGFKIITEPDKGDRWDKFERGNDEITDLNWKYVKERCEREGINWPRG